jgi:hypothetical protein
MKHPRPTTYGARVSKTEAYVGKEVSSYTVRWKVGTETRRTFRKSAQAESFRSKLIAAVRDGEAPPRSWPAVFTAVPGISLLQSPNRELQIRLVDSAGWIEPRQGAV